VSPGWLLAVRPVRLAGAGLCPPADGFVVPPPAARPPLGDCGQGIAVVLEHRDHVDERVDLNEPIALGIAAVQREMAELVADLRRPPRRVPVGRRRAHKHPTVCQSTTIGTPRGQIRRNSRTPSGCTERSGRPHVPSHSSIGPLLARQPGGGTGLGQHANRPSRRMPVLRSVSPGHLNRSTRIRPLGRVTILPD